MRIVQVGCMGMGRHWVSVGRGVPEVNVVGYVDVVPSHLDAIQTDFGIPKDACFSDLGEALDRLRPDGVLIVTPPQFHAPIAVQAMEAGCHVLTEKPLAPTWETCLEMVHASRRTGKIVMVAQNYRYRPAIQALRNAVLSGAYGEAEQVRVDFYRGPHFGGFREEMPFPLIVDMSIHHFDLMRYILNVDPVSVEAKSWNPSWSWYRGDASSMCHFEMRRGERPVHVTYTGSWCTRGGNTTWNGDWTIFLQNGCLTMENDRVYVQTSDDGPKEELPAVEMPRTDQHYLLAAFAECVRTGHQPETSAEDNLKSIAMVFKSVESCEKGGRATFELLDQAS